ncbi:MAG TPA: GerMN domain-containing protein [Terriglobales bacterium]
MIPRHLQIGVVVLLFAALIMAFYVRRMRGRAAEDSAEISDQRPIAAPVSAPTEQVTLYVAYDDVGVLHAQSARIPLPAGRQQRAQELVRALLAVYADKHSPHPIPDGADIRDVFIVDPGMVVIDLNAVFADQHRSGVLVEELTVTSMVETVAGNLPGINRVKILVDGKARETLAGHADLSGFIDTGSVSLAMNQLQNAQ